MTQFEKMEITSLQQTLSLRLGEFRAAEKALATSLAGTALCLGRIRRGKRISLMTMARKLKMSHSTIANMETGRFVNVKGVEAYLKCITRI